LNLQISIIMAECAGWIRRFVEAQLGLECRGCKGTMTLPIGKALES
jgi:hypothetical protein